MQQRLTTGRLCVVERDCISCCLKGMIGGRGRSILIVSFLFAMIFKLSRSLFMGSQSIRLNALAGSSFKHSSTYTRNSIPKLEIGSTQSFNFVGDLLVIPFYKPVGVERGQSADAVQAAALVQHVPPEVDEHLRKIITDVLHDGVFKADVSSKQLIRLHGARGTSKYVALVGLGPDPKKGKAGEMDVKSASRLGKSVASLAKEVKASSVGVIMPPSVDNAGVSPLLVAIQDALYVDERFKKVPEDGFPALHWKTLTLLGCSKSVSENIALTGRLASMIASGVQLTKDLVGTPLSFLFVYCFAPKLYVMICLSCTGAPPCSKTPVAIAELARAMAAEHNLECKILGQVTQLLRPFVCAMCEIRILDTMLLCCALYFYPAGRVRGAGHGRVPGRAAGFPLSPAVRAPHLPGAEPRAEHREGGARGQGPHFRQVC